MPTKSTEATRLLNPKEWIQACGFHDLTEADILAEVTKRVKEQKALALIIPAGGQSMRGVHPLVLLDLDSTLYEVQPRTHQIIKEWLATDVSRDFQLVKSTLMKLSPDKLGYSLSDTFVNMNMVLSHPEIKDGYDNLKRFWAKRFFDSSYLQYDVAYPGAARFVQELYDLGAELVYLTGRDEPGMGQGTRQNLLRDRFPWDAPRTHLLMKKSFELDDLEHKLAAGTYVRQHGTLIASFENEPPNIVGLYDAFPDAMHVFVDTVCSDRPALTRHGLYRIGGFEFD